MSDRTPPTPDPTPGPAVTTARRTALNEDTDTRGAATVEFPVYAILLGLLGNVVLSRPRHVLQIGAAAERGDPQVGTLLRDRLTVVNLLVGLGLATLLFSGFAAA